MNFNSLKQFIKGMEHKYCIREKLRELPITEYRRLLKEIPIAINKTKRTFDRYCSIRADEFGDIPTQDLDIIASHLSCSPNELKNYTVQNKQIRQLADPNQ